MLPGFLLYKAITLYSHYFVFDISAAITKAL